MIIKIGQSRESKLKVGDVVKVQNGAFLIVKGCDEKVTLLDITSMELLGVEYCDIETMLEFCPNLKYVDELKFV